jgi:hypothetical protein
MANSTTHLPPIALFMLHGSRRYYLRNMQYRKRIELFSSSYFCLSTAPRRHAKRGIIQTNSNLTILQIGHCFLCSSSGILHGRQLPATWQHAQLLYEMAQLVANPDERISRKRVFISRALYKPWGSFKLFTCELLQKRARKNNSGLNCI